VAIILTTLTTAAATPPAPVDPAAAAATLADAQAQLAAVEVELDRLAAALDAAVAHAATLEAEEDGAGERVRVAESAWEAAAAQAATAIRQRYMYPTLPLTWALRALGQQTTGSVLHQIALTSHVPIARLDQAGAARRATVLAADEQQQHAAVVAGTAQATRDLVDGTRRMEDALRLAGERVAGAREVLDAARRAAVPSASLPPVVTVQGEPVADRPLSWPPVMACPLGLPNGFSSSWGAPRSGGRSHQGVDMFAARGTPVVAAADGQVRVGSNGLGGLTVDLYDVAGNRYYYAHMDSTAVADGQQVVAGQIIGGAGTSGNAAGTPPHLHWQVHPGAQGPVDPYPLAAALCRP
jgi:peptidoglycan LD-endopeptidase LytH